MTSRTEAIDGLQEVGSSGENSSADAAESLGESFTLEAPDPERYRSGPAPLSSRELTEQLRESDREANRRQGQTWAVAVIMTLAASVLVLITHVV